MSLTEQNKLELLTCGATELTCPTATWDVKIFPRAAIMSLTASSSFTQSSTPARSTELACGAYVLAIAQLENEYAALSSAPSNKIHLYDRASLRPAASFDAHSTAGTSLRSVDNINGTSRRVLLSSGKDATVKVWDARTPTPALTSASRQTMKET